MGIKPDRLSLEVNIKFGLPVFCLIYNNFASGSFIHMFLNSSQNPLNRLEAGDALGLERLDGVCLQLIVTRKAFVKADDSLRLHVRDTPD